MDVIQLVEPTFVNGLHLTFVVGKHSTIGSLGNFSVLLCILFDAFRNLWIENLMCQSFKIDYIGLLIVSLTPLTQG